MTNNRKAWKTTNPNSPYLNVSFYSFSFFTFDYIVYDKMSHQIIFCSNNAVLIFVKWCSLIDRVMGCKISRSDVLCECICDDCDSAHADRSRVQSRHSN